MINRRSPGQAEWQEIAGADHGLDLYPDEYAAYLDENGARAPQLYVTPVSRWLRRITGLKTEQF